MGKVKLYDLFIPSGQIVRERDIAYLRLPPEEKLFRLLSLIRLSIELNGSRPLRSPQAKGLLIFRKK